MSYRDTSSFGKRMEYNIIGEMLIEGYDVYLPMVDDHGVDCIVKTNDGTSIEIQIKARSGSAKQPGCFTVDNHETEFENFYFIFYCEINNTKWVFSSKDFVENSNINKSGKNKGRRKINLLSSNGKLSKKYLRFVSDNYNFLKR